MKLSKTFEKAVKTCLFLSLTMSSQLFVAQNGASGINVANKTIRG